MDNASANTTFIQELGQIIQKQDIADCHFRCLCHILNLGVQDILKILNYGSIELADLYENGTEEYLVENENFIAVGQIISKIRLLFIRIRQSEQMRKKLKSICENIENIQYVEPILVYLREFS